MNRKEKKARRIQLEMVQEWERLATRSAFMRSPNAKHLQSQAQKARREYEKGNAR